PFSMQRFSIRSGSAGVSSGRKAVNFSVISRIIANGPVLVIITHLRAQLLSVEKPFSDQGFMTGRQREEGRASAYARQPRPPCAGNSRDACRQAQNHRFHKGGAREDCLRQLQGKGLPPHLPLHEPPPHREEGGQAPCPAPAGLRQW